MAWTIRQMDDFAGLAGMGMAQPWWYPSIRCSVWGHSGPHAGRLDVHIAPAVGATSFPAPRGKYATPPEQSRPLRKRSQSRRNYKVGCWHGVFGEHVRSFPNISELTGGDCGEGRATVSLSRAPTAPRLAALVHQRKPRRPRASAGDSRPFSRRKESNEVGHE